MQIMEPIAMELQTKHFTMLHVSMEDTEQGKKETKEGGAQGSMEDMPLDAANLGENMRKQWQMETCYHKLGASTNAQAH